MTYIIPTVVAVLMLAVTRATLFHPIKRRNWEDWVLWVGCMISITFLGYLLMAAQYA